MWALATNERPWPVKPSAGWSQPRVCSVRVSFIWKRVVGWEKPTGPAFGRPDDRLRVPTKLQAGERGAREERAFAHLKSHYN
jgi:hypothetical protein